MPAFADPEQQRDAFIALAEGSGISSQELATLRALRHKMPVTFSGEDARGLRELLRRDVFVFCMSASRSHPLQWSHYADEHKGVCVHFDGRKPPILAALAVDYTSHYPAIKQPSAKEEYERNFIRCAMTKATWWEYEQEFRIVVVKPSDAPNDWAMGTAPVQLSPNIVCGLTLGAMMEPDVRESVVAWCREHRPELRIEVAALDDTDYKLNFSYL